MGGRGKIPFIYLKLHGGVCYTHQEKEAVLFHHYSTHFSMPEPRKFSLNWDEIALPRRELAHLEDPFTVEDVLAVMTLLLTRRRGQMDLLGVS